MTENPYEPSTTAPPRTTPGRRKVGNWILAFGVLLAAVGGVAYLFPRIFLIAGIKDERLFGLPLIAGMVLMFIGGILRDVPPKQKPKAFHDTTTHFFP
jgi:hypothetical protein